MGNTDVVWGGLLAGLLALIVLRCYRGLDFQFVSPPDRRAPRSVTWD
jgi:hypothetical protein